MLVVSEEGKLFDIISSDFAGDWGYTARKDYSPLIIQRGL